AASCNRPGQWHCSGPGSARAVASSARLAPAPLVLQQAEDFGIGGAAVDQEALPQRALAAESKPGQEPSRGLVARVDVRLDSVQAEPVETPVQCQRDRLARQALSPALRMQRIADFRAAMPGIEPVQGATADRAVVPPRRDQPVERVSARESLERLL